MTKINAVREGFDHVEVQRASRGEWFVLTVKDGKTWQHWNYSNGKLARQFGEGLASDYGVEYYEPEDFPIVQGARL